MSRVITIVLLLSVAFATGQSALPSGITETTNQAATSLIVILTAIWTIVQEIRHWVGKIKR